MDKPLKHDPLSPRSFLHHFLRNLILGFSLLLIILMIGILGYHHFEKTNWTDSYANAAMIISGVGTLNNPETEKGKIFVATYSIIGGASFLLVIAVVFSPIFHWLFRQVKVEDREHFRD
jgi:hypothetical protein